LKFMCEEQNIYNERAYNIKNGSLNQDWSLVQDTRERKVNK